MLRIIRSISQSRAAAGAVAMMSIAGPALAATTSSKAQPARLPIAVVNGQGVFKQGSTNTSYNFGTTVHGLSKLIEHDFLLRNQTNSTVSLDRVVAACTCATLTLEGAGPGNTVAPGKTFTVHMSLIADQLPESGLDKVAWLYVTGRAKPVLTMHMTGALKPSLSYRPAMIDFRTVPVDQTQAVPLKITFDTRVYGANPPDPAVDGTAMISVKRLASHTEAGGRQLVRSYNVKLDPQGHLGRFDAGISMPRPYSRGGGSVFITGEVEGSIVCSPRAVPFGTVMRGQTVSRQIVLKGLSPDALAGLSLSSDTKDLTAKLVHTGGKGGNTALVEVSVSPSTPGALLSNVIVATKNGQVLKVLVSAWVN